MSYNGSGTFQINTSGQPVVAGTVISSTAFNALTADLATGLSTAITKDGQTTTTARIPFAAGINSSLTTDSTNSTSGSIITAGGVGVAKALFVGTTANVAGAVTLQSTLGVTGVSTLTGGAIVEGLTVGKGAGAVSTNTAVGASALAANSTGNNSTAIGYETLKLSTGDANTAIGAGALDANTSGSFNSAVGRSALGAATTANSNSAFGYLALLSNTTGASNVSVGAEALYSNTTAINNTAVGYQAGYSQTTTGYGTFLGQTAGYATTGISNTFVGQQAGALITSGAKNTIIGRYDGNQGGLDIRTASNYIVLSDGDGNPRGFFDGSGNYTVGVAAGSWGSASGNQVSPAFQQINKFNGVSGDQFIAFSRNSSTIGSITQSGTTAVLFNVTSDQRLKENIVDAPEFGSVIDSIQVRSYDWKSDGNHQRAGFIAQELVTVAPEAVHQPSNTNEMMAVDYSKLVPMLVKEIQSLRKRLAALESN